MTASILLTMSSVGFMVPGLVRTKMAGLVLGEQGIAIFGQLSQLQTLMITLGGAGLATATRVILARNDLAPRERDSAQAWLLWIPASLAMLIFAGVITLSPQISKLILGNSSFFIDVSLAAAGIPLAVMGQVLLASAQARRENANLVIAATMAALLGGCAVAALMVSGEATLMATSLVAGPAVQLAVIVGVCKSARPGFLSRPRLDKGRRQEVYTLAWASLLLGGFASVAELASRSSVVYFRGLAELAPYQPVTLLVTTSMSLILGSLATSSLMELGGTNDRLELGRRITDIAVKILPLLGVVISVGIALSPLAVGVLYVPTLVDSSALLIVFAFAGEPLRGLAWIAGSCLLPLGRRTSWLCAGLATVAVQAGVSLSLAQAWGAYALVAGMVGASIMTVIATLFVLRRARVRPSSKATLVGVGVAALVSGTALFSFLLLNSVVYGAALSASVLVIYVSVQSRNQKVEKVKV